MNEERELAAIGLSINFNKSALAWRRRGVERLAYYNSPDCRRLVPKLIDPELSRLMDEASELLVSGVEKIKPARVYDELGLNTFMVDRNEVYTWRTALQDELEKFSYRRLDWLWDMSWSFSLWPRKTFKAVHLAVYCAVRGEVPRNVDQPYQYILTAERKHRIRRWERQLYVAAKNQDYQGLKQLGLSEVLIDRAITHVKGELDSAD